MKVLSQAPAQAEDSQTRLSETIRAELWAYRVISKSSLIRQVQNRLSPWEDTPAEAIQEILTVFQRQRQIMAGPQGKVAATPLRLIQRREQNYLLVGGPPSGLLSHHFQLQIEPSFPLRQISLESEHELEKLLHWGSKILSPEDWAGLKESLPAGEDFLAQLDAQLQENPAQALPEELRWKAYVPKTGLTQKQRWQTSDTGYQLWRAWHSYGYWVYAWTGGGLPIENPGILLKTELALRACFSLDQTQACPLEISAKQTENTMVFLLSSLLPASEYRFLSLYAQQSKTDLGIQYRLDLEDWPTVKALLEQRLGMKIEEEIDGH